MDKILKFDELGEALRERFFTEAHLLIDKKYVTNTTVDALAEKIYNSYIKDRVENQPTNATAKKSFLDYDKSSVTNPPEIKKDDNWLK